MRARTGLVTVSVLAVAVGAVSVSGPLIAFAAAPAFAIAFWRNAMAVGLLGPLAVARRREELATLALRRRSDAAFSALAGVALTVHFVCWVPSVKLTTVATATALVATQPVWQGIISSAQGRRLPALSWVGIAVAVAGAVAATGADLSVSATAVGGDLLAMAGGIAAAVYTALGERARVNTSTTTYTFVCYSVCAGITLLVCLVVGIPLGGYPGTAWLALVGLTVGPQLLGHSLFNFALRRVAATTISVVVLLEVPGAAFVGWWWLGQTVRPSAWPGLILLLAGVVIVVLAGRRARDRAIRLVEEPEAGVIAPEPPSGDAATARASAPQPDLT
ncbi:MAG TPA: DMT family transporter [Micromonosporaceae bacterium]